MRSFLETKEIREQIFAPPVASQDILLIIFIWFLASLPWLSGSHYIPYDSVDQFYPQSQFVVESLKGGELPWWNPYQYSGLPVFGDPQGMLFSLHTIAGVLLGSPYTLYFFDLITLLHPIIGGIAIYTLGYRISTPRVWVLSASLLFILGGVATSRLQHVPQIIAYAGLPIILLGLHYVKNSPGLFRAAVLGILVAFWAANANQVVFLGALLLLGAAIYLILTSPKPHKTLFFFGIAAATAGALVAPHYSAILEIISISTRNDLTIADSAHASFPPVTYVSLFFPALFGNLGGTKWSPTDITQDFLYIGLIPLFLYLLAFSSKLRWSNYLVISWISALGFYLVFSLGVNTPVYRFLFNNIPGFDLFRRPADAAFLINFILALGLLIFGKELARLRNNPNALLNSKVSIAKPEVRAIILIAMPLFAFWIGAIAQSRGGLSVLLENYGWLVLRGLLFIGALWAVRQLTLKKRSIFFSWLIFALFFAADLGSAGRFSGSFSPAYRQGFIASAYEEGEQAEAADIREWFDKNVSPSTKIEIIGGSRSLGYSSWARLNNTQGYNPIKLKNYAEKIGAFITFTEPRVFWTSSGPFDEHYDILGLSYVAFDSKWAEGAEKRHSPAAEESRQYRDILQKAGGRKVFFNSYYEIWERPHQSLWLSVYQPELQTELKPAPCKLDYFGAARIEISCASDVGSRLVVGEIYAPGWYVCVNHKPAQLESYKGLFRSVDIPQGTSTVVMRYQPIPLLRPSGC